MGITGITAFRNVPNSTSSWVTGYQLYYGLTSGSAGHDRPGRELHDEPVGHCPLTVTFTDTSTEPLLLLELRRWHNGPREDLHQPWHLHRHPDRHGPGGEQHRHEDHPGDGRSLGRELHRHVYLRHRPLAVAFIETSTGSITAWSWSFGDGGTSTPRNPAYTYATAGHLHGQPDCHRPADGTNTKTQSGYITVSSSTKEPSINNVNNYRCAVG